ncbi:MAG: DUF1232 domain-containing protein [Bacteroidales bacterium]|nr:DUF1232 domain-containing protein [Bacteroidales bacterium]
MSKKFSKETSTLFTSFYSPEKLFSKIGTATKKAGVKVVYAALLLYYSLLDKEVPIKDKAIVIGALGYFILPADLIPDFLPGGYADDSTALILAVKTIWSNITVRTKEKARVQLSKWFNNVNSSDLQLF